MMQQAISQTFNNKVAYSLTLLLIILTSISFMFSSSAQAANESEMAALFEQAFGKKGKTTTKTDSEDLSALYTQAFGKEKGNKKPNNSSEPSNSGSSDLIALYAKAFGKTASATPSKITVELRVNKSVIGEVPIFSSNNGGMDKAEAKTILDLLKGILKEHIHKRIKERLSVNKKVSFKALTSLGMKAVYNSVNLSLDLQINPALRKPQVLSMRTKRKVSVRDENKITAEEISAFLNMYSTVGFNSDNKNKPDVKVKLEGSINIENVVLETSATLKKQGVKIGRTTLTYDRPEKLQRFVVGNISTGNRNFQENLELIGLRASKEFFMKPELQIRPSANQAFILESDSQVEVYINDRLRRRYHLNEGIYSLEDIGLYNGVNNIRVKITDEFGKITIKTSEQYYDSHLLKPELELYSISVGYLSNRQAHIREELEHKPIFSAYYERGITKNLTMSFDAQMSPSSYLLGAEIRTSVALGSIKHSIAVSGGTSNKTGYATRFEFKPYIQRELIGLDTLSEDMLGLDTTVGRFLNSWTISGEYRSEDFSMINQQLKHDNINDISKKLKGRLQTQFSVNLSDDWRGSLNIGISDYYDSEKAVSANISATKAFNNGIRISLGAKLDSNDDTSINLQLTIPLDREERRSRKHLEFLVNSKDESYSSKLSYSPTSFVGKNSLAGSVEYSHNQENNNAKLDLQYRDSKFETSLSARHFQDLKNNSANSQRLNLGFNTSFACIGTQCGSSYPINDSFALVTGPSNQDNPIAINNGHESFRYSDENDSNLPDNYTALIPDKGAYAVVPLESFRYQNINIDESTLPNGYDSDKTEFEVFPLYHQGFLVKAGGEPATIVDGTLVNKANKPLAYKGGQWIPLANEAETVAFFSNKVGRFRIPSFPAGNYKLELFDYPDMEEVSIVVPDLKGQVHDIGSIVVIN